MRYIPLIILLMIPFAYADECKGTVNQEEVPCDIYLPNDNCTNVQVSFYDNTSTLLQTRAMGQFTPFLCNQTFNYSTIGTYVFNYSTGDSGSIIVEEGNVTTLLLFFGLIASFILFGFGFYKEDSTFLSVGGILMMTMGVFIIINGFSILSNILTIGLGSILFGVGGYVLLRTNIENIGG